MDNITCPLTGEVIWEPLSLQTIKVHNLQYVSRFLTDFEEIGLLGVGGFGHVVQVRNKLDECIYAVKKVLLKKTNCFLKARREVITLSRLEHPNIMRYYSSWIEPALVEKKDLPYVGGGKRPYEELDPYSDDSDEGELDPSTTPCLYIQLEYCPSSLGRILGTPETYEEDANRSQKWFHQLLEGLAHIHRKGIVHRDISRSNIFIDAEDNVKIGDFGLAKLEEDDHQFSPDSGVETPLYRAPELVEGSIINTKVDIFSLGILYFELFQKFDSESERVELLTALLSKREIPDSWTGSRSEILCDMLLKLPEERKSAQQLLLFLQRAQEEGDEADKEGEAEDGEDVSFE